MSDAGVSTAVSRAACPICGSVEVREARPTLEGERAVLCCRECEFVFILPRIEQDFTALPAEAYYDDWQMLDIGATAAVYAEVVIAARRAGLFAAAATTDSPERLSVLDVGCGAGHTLLHFRAHGWDVRGVDPWRAVTVAGSKYYRLPIDTARIEHAALPPQSQHVVLAIDMLQFVADPRAILEACRTVLKPGGLLYVTVPNYGASARERDGWNWAYFIPACYLNYFTAQALTRLARTAGFTKVEVARFGGPDGDDFLRLTAVSPLATTLTWADLSAEVPDNELPPLDRREIDERALSPEQRAWREDGHLVVRGLIPDHLIDRYCAVFRRLGTARGYSSPTPYLDVTEIRDLCLYKPLTDLLEHLIGEPMALHLNLTGWISTERDWHQDDYLNPPEVNGHYAAVWMALDDIEADSGPFEFIPRSHRWPIIRQSKVLALLGRDNGDDPSWPWDSERLLTPFFDREVTERDVRIERFLGKKGDVLVWHSRLVHRGSPPRRQGAERRAIISHYSAAGRRRDMRDVRRHPGGGLYFALARAATTNGPAGATGVKRVVKRLLRVVARGR